MLPDYSPAAGDRDAALTEALARVLVADWRTRQAVEKNEGRASGGRWTPAGRVLEARNREHSTSPPR
jgi:hypothetical protein